MWRALATSELHWRTWGDEVVAYHAASGDTHVLNPAAAAALRAMQQEPRDRDALCHIVGDLLQTDPADEQLVAIVERMLGDLDELGLIEPANEASRPDSQ
jgi:PqqD family protein of HPr-rel-A system